MLNIIYIIYLLIYFVFNLFIVLKLPIHTRKLNYILHHLSLDKTREYHIAGVVFTSIASLFFLLFFLLFSQNNFSIFIDSNFEQFYYFIFQLSKLLEKSSCKISSSKKLRLAFGFLFLKFENLNASPGLEPECSLRIYFEKTHLRNIYTFDYDYIFNQPFCYTHSLCFSLFFLFFLISFLNILKNQFIILCLCIHFYLFVNTKIMVLLQKQR